MEKVISVLGRSIIDKVGQSLFRQMLTHIASLLRLARYIMVIYLSVPAIGYCKSLIVPALNGEATAFVTVSMWIVRASINVISELAEILDSYLKKTKISVAQIISESCRGS